MNRKRRTILLLLAVHAVAMIGAFAATYETPTMLAFSLAYGQGSLLAIWAAMSGRRRPWRFLAVMIVLIVIAIDAGQVKRLRDLEDLLGLMGSQLFAAAPFLFLLRFVGFELTATPASFDGDIPRKLQFSLRSLMAWTTGSAVLFSVLSIFAGYLLPMGQGWVEELLRILAMLGLMGLLAMVTVCAALGTERTWLRFTMFGLALLVLGALLDLVIDDPPRGYTFLIFLCSNTWTFASLWVFRALGYRLIPRKAAG